MPTRPNAPNARIWETADQFFRAAEYISQYENSTGLIFPLMVNYALSCELSLKASESVVKFSELSLEEESLIPAVAAESAVRGPGHDLQVIYERLSLPVKEALKTEFMTITEAELMPLLEKCSNYFVRARYPYEYIGDGYPLSDIHLLADGLLQSVRAYGVSQGQ